MNTQNKSNKVVLISGVSSGIGKATAERFLKAGHTVYGFARRTELMADLEELGGNIMGGDVRDEASVRAVVDWVIAAEGRIDVLVNNAGYIQYGPVEDVPIEAAMDQFDTNVYGYARLIKAVMPHMRAAGRGRIINVTSVAGRVSAPFITWYAASKFALEGLLDAFRGEAKLSNVDVVLIEPGFIHTDIYRVAWGFYDRIKLSPVHAKMGERFKKAINRLDQNAPGPEVIANGIYRAATAKRPKTRYALPGDAKFYLALKALLPDRWFDRLMLTNLRD
jgi:NAD(P)-dependent dehydrogenase (short-subunit alcohol dehydrogenase family)